MSVTVLVLVKEGVEIGEAEAESVVLSVLLLVRLVTFMSGVLLTSLLLLLGLLVECALLYSSSMHSNLRRSMDVIVTSHSRGLHVKGNKHRKKREFKPLSSLIKVSLYSFLSFSVSVPLPLALSLTCSLVVCHFRLLVHYNFV